MKYLFTFLSLFTINVVSQPGGSLGWSLAEIFIGTEGLIEDTYMRYEILAQGIVWCAEDTFPPSNHEICTEYNIGYYPRLTRPPTFNSSFISPGGWYGFNYLLSVNEAYPNNMDSYIYGLYKITAIFVIIENNQEITTRKAFFYYDYRDCRGADYFGYPVNGHNLDIWLKYDTQEDKFYYSSQGATPPFIITWTPISTSEYLKHWVVKDQESYGSPQSDCFPNFWKNCLVLIPSINNNVHLVWGSNPDLENISGYKIYRAIHSVPNPRPKVFSLIATVDDETFDYIDYDVRIDEEGDYIWYYLKAYNSQTESPGSNVVTTNGGLYKKNNFDKISSNGYGLNQNFPNPFNPVTLIKYSLAQDADVTIKVYDMLGREVDDLVNELKQEGSYVISFNAENLSSGVYIYRITATNNGKILFTESKQMTLLR